MTQEMYGATGRVGNKTYYRSNGKTIAREVVTPKNPKTDAQTIQRVIAAQVGKSYNKLRAIVDHSFEGVSSGRDCMNRFRKLNMRNLRDRAAEIQASGNSLAQFYNFQPVGSIKWVPGSLILAQGQLTKVTPQIGQNSGGVYVGTINIEGNTYGDVIRALGAKRGDQLTFIGICAMDGEYSAHYARIILDPRNANGTGAALSTPFIVDGAVNLPNWKNNGEFDILGVTAGSDLNFKLGAGVQVACSVIVSRKSGEDWLRSNANLVVSEEACGSDKCSLWDAMETSYQSGSIDLESEHYLNNAGVGGGQGTDGQQTTDNGQQTGGGSNEGGSTGGNTGGNEGGGTGGGDNGGGGGGNDDPNNSED